MDDLDTVDIAGVGDVSSDGVHLVPDLSVTSWRATRAEKWLRRAVIVSCGPRLWVGGGNVGGLKVWVDIQRDLVESLWEGVVSRVVIDGAEGGSGSSLALGWLVRTGVKLRDLEVGVFVCGIAETIAKLISWSDVLCVEVAVIDEEALGEVDLRAVYVETVDNIHTIVLTALTPGEDSLALWVDRTPDDINKSITGFLAWKTSPEDGGDVGVVLVFLEDDGTDGVDNKDGVGVKGSNVSGEFVSITPESKVVTVTLVGVDCDVVLATVSIGKNEGNLGTGNGLGNSLQVVVVADVGNGALVLCSLSLDSSNRGNQVREVGSTATPSHSKRVVVTATVTAGVGSGWVIMGIFSDDGNALWLLEREDLVLVLQQHGGRSANLTDKMGVVVFNVDVPVDLGEVLLGLWVKVAKG